MFTSSVVGLGSGLSPVEEREKLGALSY